MPGRLVRDRRGAGAVEFALVAPIFLAMTLGIVAVGYVLALGHGLQQLAGEAARASLSGITDTERTAIARSFVADNVLAYGLIDPVRLQVAISGSAAPGNTFQVALTYDLRDLFFTRLGPWTSFQDAELRRVAVIQRGGY